MLISIIVWFLVLVSAALYFAANRISKGCNIYDDNPNIPIDEKIKRLNRSMTYTAFGIVIGIAAFTLSIINLVDLFGLKSS